MSFSKAWENAKPVKAKDLNVRIGDKKQPKKAKEEKKTESYDSAFSFNDTKEGKK